MNAERTKLRMNPLDWDLGNVPPGIAWGGVDEAGRGAWAGPVVAACAVIDSKSVEKWRHVLRSARDSKKLRPEKREVLASELKQCLAAWAVAEVDNLAIDRENILEATFSAMRKAVAKVSVRPRILLIDGDKAPGTGLLERVIVDGDALSCAIACASILAKTHRDRIMREMAVHYPEYAFEQHKGYGTGLHQERMKALGACPIHRVSYAPVAALVQADEARWHGLRMDLLRCRSTEELAAWIDTQLRPAYGKLERAWIDELRERYARRLIELSDRGIDS